VLVREHSGERDPGFRERDQDSGEDDRMAVLHLPIGGCHLQLDVLWFGDLDKH
jgi:hypothetical protein